MTWDPRTGDYSYYWQLDGTRMSPRVPPQSQRLVLDPYYWTVNGRRVYFRIPPGTKDWAQNPGIYDIRKDPWMIGPVRDDEELPVLLAAFMEILK